MAYLPKRENPILSKQERRYAIRTLTYLGILETKKINTATTLGAKKKGSVLKKPKEKMTNAPVRTAASEPSQHTTETTRSRAK